MFSTRKAVLATAAVFALAVASLALAGPGPASTSAVSASFYANTLVRSHAQTCTGANNDSYQVTDAVFTGTAASTDSHLNGAATIHVRSVYDATTNLGSIDADVHIGTSTAPPSQFHGHLEAVNVNGTVQGYLTGNESGGTHVQGNVTATFSATGGFSSSTTQATFGSGSGADTAIATSGGCHPTPAGPPSPPKVVPNPKPDHPGIGPKPDRHPGKGPKHHR
jgi:hypothetical protein